MKIVYQSFRLVLAILIISVGIFVLRWQLTKHITVDYIAYWSAARLAITGGNPYNTYDMLKIEEEIGWPTNSGQSGLPDDYAHMMFNPPWTIFFILPFGLVDYLTSRAIFYFLCVGIIFFSVDRFWKTLGGRITHIWIVLLLVFTFPATVSLIDLGNIAIFPLLGIVLFILLIKKDKYFWAGTTLSLMLIKPQNIYLFLVALVVWVLVEKRWMVLLGAFISLAISTGITLIFIPSVFKDYLELMSMGRTDPWLNATIGSFIRLRFGYDLVWLIYLPIIPGLIWFFLYWVSHHNNWNWDKAMPYLLLISAVTSPWGWLLDITLSIPAIIYITFRLIYGWKQIKSAQHRSILVLLFIYAIVTEVMTFQRGMLFPYAHNLWWYSTFLLICFIGLDRFSRIEEQEPTLNLL